MDTTRGARRPTAPGGGRPGVCRYCEQPTGDRTRAHAECRKAWRQVNVPADVRETVFERDGYRCIDCGPRSPRLPESMLEADHDHELADGGRNEPGNYVTRCKPHHQDKTQERRMARTQAPTKNARAGKSAQTAQIPDAPRAGDTMRALASLAAIVLGAGIVARAVGHDLTRPLGLGVVGVAVVALSVFGMRWFHWRRVCEAQRVFERLAKVADLPYAARARAMKVTSWAGVEPRGVTLTYGRGFNDADDASWTRLASAYAQALGVQPGDVTFTRKKRGRAHLAVVGHYDTSARAAENVSDEPRPVESAQPPADLDAVTARVRDALSTVLNDDCTVQVTAWHPDGAPSALTLVYPPAATKTARDARADLPTVMADVFTPRSTNGRWKVTWQSAHDRFLFADEPDPLAPIVPLPPIEANLDLTAGPVLGVTEDGTPWRQPVLHAHVLVAGATGAGKGSVLWGIIRGVAPLIADGRCKLYVSDPKGGMELGILEPIAHRFALGAGTAEMLEEACEDMEAQAQRLRKAGIRKLTEPTVTNPLRLIIVDEVAALAADKEAGAAMTRLLQQGRAVGVCVVGALQDPRVKNLDSRGLYPYAIALRLKDRAHTDMVLGAGARAAGAVCDRIPIGLPGVGYVVADGKADTLRVRAAFVPDDEIARLAAPAARAPEHAQYADTEQLAIEHEVYAHGDPEPVGRVIERIAPMMKNITRESLGVPTEPAPDLEREPDAPTPVAPPARPVRMDKLEARAHVTLPEDTDPVVIIKVEPDEDDPDDRVLVTYIYDGEQGERDCSFDRDSVATPV